MSTVARSELRASCERGCDRGGQGTRERSGRHLAVAPDRSLILSCDRHPHRAGVAGPDHDLRASAVSGMCASAGSSRSITFCPSTSTRTHTLRTVDTSAAGGRRRRWSRRGRRGLRGGRGALRLGDARLCRRTRVAAPPATPEHGRADDQHRQQPDDRRNPPGTAGRGRREGGRNRAGLTRRERPRSSARTSDSAGKSAVAPDGSLVLPTRPVEADPSHGRRPRCASSAPAAFRSPGAVEDLREATSEAGSEPATAPEHRSACRPAPVARALILGCGRPHRNNCGLGATVAQRHGDRWRGDLTWRDDSTRGGAASTRRCGLDPRRRRLDPFRCRVDLCAALLPTLRSERWRYGGVAGGAGGGAA